MEGDDGGEDRGLPTTVCLSVCLSRVYLTEYPCLGFGLGDLRVRTCDSRSLPFPSSTQSLLVYTNTYNPRPPRQPETTKLGLTSGPDPAPSPTPLGDPSPKIPRLVREFRGSRRGTNMLTTSQKLSGQRSFFVDGVEGQTCLRLFWVSPRRRLGPSVSSWS